jgi:hypothetical protein
MASARSVFTELQIQLADAEAGQALHSAWQIAANFCSAPTEKEKLFHLIPGGASRPTASERKLKSKLTFGAVLLETCAQPRIKCF